MACGTSPLGRVTSQLRSWRPRIVSGTLRTPGESTLVPRSSNATDFSSYASQDRFVPNFGAITQIVYASSADQRLDVELPRRAQRRAAQRHHQSDHAVDPARRAFFQELPVAGSVALYDTI